MIEVTDELALEGLRGRYRVPSGAKICYIKHELEDMKLALEAVFKHIEKEAVDNLMKGIDKGLNNAGYEKAQHEPATADKILRDGEGRANDFNKAIGCIIKL